jgi:hypothetical protein
MWRTHPLGFPVLKIASRQRCRRLSRPHSSRRLWHIRNAKAVRFRRIRTFAGRLERELCIPSVLHGRRGSGQRAPPHPAGSLLGCRGRPATPCSGMENAPGICGPAGSPRPGSNRRRTIRPPGAGRSSLARDWLADSRRNASYPRCLSMNRRMRLAISSFLSSRAKCPASSRWTSAWGRSRLKASAPAAINEGSFRPQTTSVGG